ncbi:MAG: hypothetical protein LBF37_01415 [Rickettsiales bacterium]|jgi:hypothetical protein|nr:hypothetical protein [Rickettsiales bacterium]
MKKQLSLFIWAVAVFGMSPVWAATNSGAYGASSADLTGAPGTRAKTNVNYEKYETRTSTKTYAAKDGNDIYYTQPAKRSDLYKEYATKSSSASTTTATRTSRAETVRSEVKRKYYLAHPFFQPLKGKFGSVTDLSYNTNSYDFVLNQTAGPALSDTKAKWDMTQFSVKEDLSYGITDRLSIMGMARFDSSKYKMDWDTAPDDSMSDSGINSYGLGLQWRFTDNSEWIATLSGYYQRQVDVANIGLLDLKGGYKVASSTVYGVARGWYVAFDENSYGNGIENGDAGLFLAYNVGENSAFYIEGGLGVFSVLDEDWTLNFEAIFGNYDWHNQGSIKAAIGWQPGNSFALNLYGKTVVYDSADDKNLDFYFKEPSRGLDDYTYLGTAKIDNYSEWSIGLQAILYF